MIMSNFAKTGLVLFAGKPSLGILVGNFENTFFFKLSE